jgi:hypothetical protein
MNKNLPKPGDQLHFLVSGFSIPREHVSEVSTRGQTVTVTQALLDASINRLGESWLEATEEEQEARYGAVRWRRGPAPDDLESWTPGSVEHDEAREKARKLAFSIADPQAQAQALAEVYAKFGRRSTSKTLQHIRGDEERAVADRAEAEREARR